MEKNWVCIFSTSTLYRAEIAKDLLHDNDVDAVIINKKDSNYQFGILEVYVERNNAIRSKHILKNVSP
ncbi:MAG: DUF2007 domain-containing protein [Bacteroidales bacterium]|jgi:hypothetical protein